MFNFEKARGAAKVIDFNCGIILLTVCRNLITVLRNTFVNSFIPLDKNITFHKLVAWTILVSAILHVGSHFFNFLHIQNGFYFLFFIFYFFFYFFIFYFFIFFLFFLFCFVLYFFFIFIFIENIEPRSEFSNESLNQIQETTSNKPPPKLGNTRSDLMEK